ncbi:hypothetical protein SIID45300_01401 [Candidatus Magnetaquicoccaceae bacterium FCR-1]|uniref:Dystroglycan-type cadherin-like domain-containing protein n=1 Tax=Candidatus Magnetaquiglobus chichijimensis TaxID=3141448 RepID=A0ABQ0C8Q9_9PROT
MRLWPWIRDKLWPSHSKGTVRPPVPTANPAPIRSRLALRLERRLMFDAAGVLTAVAALHHDADGHDADQSADHAPILTPPGHDAATPAPREILFIDATVENHQALLKDLPTDVQVVMLDPNRDGVEQIRATLSGLAGIEALHIVSHGAEGTLALGKTELDVVNLEDHAHALQDWGAALSEHADILIYGCDVGAGMSGAAFVSRVAELTGADVAASNNLTGATERGGDWNLEVAHGSIETDVFVSSSARLAFHGVLPSANPIIVSVNGDVLSYNEGSGALVIDQGGNVTVTDADSPDFNGGQLTVSITANRDTTDDVLAIRNQGTGVGQIGVSGANVTYQGSVIGTFAGGTGSNDLVVTLNANANPTSVTALLRNITYTNTDTNAPSTATRSIAFRITDGDGGTSTTSTASTTVTAVNDAPTITGGSALTYTENNPATVINPTLTLADVDNANLQGATITISGNYQSGADTLSFTNTASITGTWNSATGTLTLTGADTVANYQAALRSIKYANSSDAPTTPTRTVTFQVSDGTTSSTTATSTVAITELNDAPVLVASGQWFIPAVLRTDATNTGATIASLFAASDITDADPTPLEGVAIYSANDMGVGTWQYRVDGGAWTNLPNPLLTTHALLLKSSDEVRFVPNNTNGGQPTLFFYAWDRTNGVAGTTVNANTRGGTTEFSSTAGIINGTVNAAPVLDIAPNPALPTITEDNLTNTGATVSSLLGTSISDIDSGALQGIAIRSVTTDNGTWQYSLNGGTSWTAFGTISSTQSLLLRPTDLVRFVPDGANPPNDTSPGSLNFTYVAWDRTGRSSVWSAGGKVSTISRGAATPFSANIETATITVTDLNDAPVLTAAAPILPAILHTDTDNAGVTIASVVGSSIGDVDAVTTPLEGIAIHTANSGSAGWWEYSTDNGATWTATGTVNATSALLLRPQDKIRFQPGGTLTTTNNASFGYYAWDQTQNFGQQGTKVNVSTRGTTTAFSTASDTASIRINIAPTLNAAATPTLPTITEDETTNSGALVSTLLGGASDIDVGASQGIAVYGLSSGNGTWQYNTGSGWTNIGTVNGTSALLLRASDSIRFVPNAIKGTTPNVSFYAWDQTTGSVGAKVDVSTRGTTTAFSVNANTATLSVTEVNDAPTLSVTASTLTFTEGGAALAINNTLTLSDVDDLNIAGATVQITGNYQSGEDVLAFVNQSGITGSWNSATGTLTLTGTATKAQYQTALRSITYQNTNNDTPNPVTRTVTFSITDGNSDGTGFGALSASGSRPIAITAINDAPTLTTTGTTLNISEGDGTTLIDPNLLLGDVDDTQLTGATVRITSNYLSSEDVLAFVNQSGITGSWNSATGTLTLTGSAAKADYQAALRSVTYFNSNTMAPSIAARTVTFTLTDANSAGQGAGAQSVSAQRIIAPVSINDAPLMSGSASAQNYSEGSAPVVIDNGIVLSDIDDANISGATVQIVGHFLASEDQLAFFNVSGITGSWNSATGTLTLTGTATKAQYQAALRTITYRNNNTDDPNLNTRTIRFTITDANSNGQGNGALSVDFERDVAVAAVNDAPTIATTGMPFAYTESDTAKVIDSALTLTDVDDTLVTGATVRITSNYLSSEDILEFADQSGIAGSWNSATGTLTLTGTATKADYQAALRTITYRNSNDNDPSIATRTVLFSVMDADSQGHGSGVLTGSAGRNIIMTAINDAPDMTTDTPLAYTEGNPATCVDAGLSLVDVDDSTIIQGLVQITGNYRASEDVLSFTNQSGITGSWDSATGTLSLTGTASKAAYEAALRSITYTNTNTDNPSTAMRTVTFTVTDGNSNGVGDTNLTTSGSRSILVSAVNDAPGVATTAAPLAYTESDAATPMDPGISLADVDDTHISGATIQITGNFLSSEDVLSFVDQPDITGSWNSATGTLTLTGSATKADYQAALRSITYQNSNDDNPSPATRTVTFSVSDSNSNGEGSGALTTTATRQILFSAVNDAPGISATAAPLAYTESDAATLMDPGISLSDVDDSHIAGATVQITRNFLSSEDVLSFVDQSGITGSWNPATGTLMLTGTATKADYQDALRSITYQNSNDDNPSPATRTVTFSVTDSNSNGEGSGALTTTATRQILFSAVNDAPGISATAAPLAYTESDAATVLDPGISLSDVDDSHIAGATVQITGNFLSSEDVLSFVDQSGITGSWNSATGTLTLTGTTTKSDYQSALRSITYQNSNDDNPSPATRTVTFSVTDSNSNGEGSGALTTTATRQILFSAVNDAPGINATAAPLAYTESDAATVLDPGISLSDVDDSHIAGATVQITGNFLSSEDVLSFVDQSGITGSWNPATGTLTLTGTASKADYQAALRTITYQNSNDDNPSPATRTVTFSVSDSNSNGEGAGALTTTATRQILFSAVNDAPGISATAAPLAYTESDAATILDPGISLSDVDDSHIAGATVQITGNFLSSEDALSFTDQSGITGSWNPATGTLTLTGTASKADYQAALRSITYQNSNDDNPSPATRTVTFSVTDSNSNGEGSGALTTTATRQILFSAVNDAPGISATAAPLAYTESDAATVLDPGISLSDVDDSHISGATVQITGNFLSSEDVLSFVDQSGITGSWNPATGTLTLTGTASKADYQAALRSITYENLNNDNPSPATRTVTFSVTDSNSNGEGSGALTTTATRQILFSAVNDAPGISATAAPLAYTESDAATVLDPGISLSDVDDSHIAGATVQITGNFLSSEDALSFTDQSGITGSWNSATGTLTLTGTATKADYQAALRSITYQNSNDDNPSPATRTVTFSVTDSNSNGEGAGTLTTTTTRQILFSAVNDAPGISATAAPLAYTESDAATILDPGISLSDVDDSHIASATVQITGNFLSSEDALSFTDQSGITSSWNPATGTLTLTGTASKADYQAALRSITYQNSNDDNPSPATRTVTFSVSDSNSNGEGSGALTTTATRQILFSAVNDAPGVATTAAPLAYTESDAATILDPGISLSDVDDSHIAGATVQITGNFLSSEDALSFTDQSGITGSWNPATGTLTLTGTATKADYQAALRSITYQNSNDDNLSPATRTITFSVTDSNSNGEGAGALTTTATRQILFSAVNDAPGISATAAPLAYTESDAATVLDPGISLSDVDDSHIAGATVQITGNFLSSEDLLNFVDQPGITGAWNSATGTLTLTGTATKSDYQSALRSITYQNSNDDNPSPATRTVTFSVSDSNSNGEGSGALTTTATRQILFSAVNDAPGVATTAAPLAYTESDAATVLDPGISLSDVDDSHIAGATIQITGNFLSSEDLLNFVDQSGITGSWNPATGTLTLTGTASKADYQAALRSITYENLNNDNPSPETRTVTFSVTDSNSNGEGSGALTTTATRQILFSAVNDAPGISATAAPLAYTESDAATILDPDISLADVDDSHIAGATVQITGNFLSSEDLLNFVDQSGITGSWNSATGTLTLTGTATKADYQAALRSITYQNSNDDNPSPATRTITFSVTDSNSNGEGAGALTTTATRQILFSAVNDAPGISATAAPLPYTESDAATPMDPGISLSDVDDSHIAGATVQITGNFLSSEDLLNFVDQPGITGSWNSATGTLTLTGTASKADYQAAFRSITYQNSNDDNPSPATRTITFSVTDSNSNGEGSGALTTTATRQILFSAVNDAPGISATAAPLAYTESDAATLMDPGISLSDVDDSHIAGATVQITGNFLSSEDALSFTDQSGITGSWNPATGTLTLTGTASKADYQAALRSITYQNSNDDNPSPATRTVTFSVTDSNSNGEGAGALTTTATRQIILTAINDAPLMSGTTTTVNHTEGEAPIFLDTAILLSDVDDANISGALIQIIGNYHADQDRLAFFNVPGITGSWDSATGTLTLTGTASKADYQAALRAVTYRNSDTDDPNLDTRTIRFTIFDANSNGQGDGALGVSIQRNLTITAVNDAPSLTSTGMPLSYTESDIPKVIDPSITLADVDDSHIVAATVQIAGNYLSNEDVLSFVEQSGITGAWNSATGTLTLTGTATKADYETALRSVTYCNSNDNDPSIATRTVLFSVTDADSQGHGSGALTIFSGRNIVMTVINDAPNMTTNTPLAYAEGDPGIPVDTGLSLVDVDDATIIHGLVQITGNYRPGEDFLSFNDQSGITGSWNAITGTLILTGTAAKGDYESALRSVTYRNLNTADPDTTPRTVTFTVTDGNSNGQGAGSLSTSGSRTILVSAVNDAPEVITTVTPLDYIESSSAIPVDPGLILNDVDDGQITGATIQITGNFLASEDVLSFVDQPDMTGSWNSATGTLTLTGTATKADYQAALRSITYQNSNDDNPSPATRTITFSVTDSNSNGEGSGALTTTATRQILFSAVNDAPGVATTAAPIAYTESDAATVLDPGISLADVDDTHIAGATVQITGNFLSSEDVLSFVDQSGITGFWNPATGTLTLTGTATKADYQAALRAITYENLNNDNPSPATRTVTFSVTDSNSNGEGTGALTTTATRQILFSAVNDAPGISATAAPLAYTESDAATVLDPGISLADVDDTHIAGATIQITGNFLSSEDALSFTDQSGITGSWNPATGTLTLTGTASKADYQAALRSITYQNSNDDNPSPATRTITFSVTDSNSNGEGSGAITTTATRQILFSAVNDAPGISATAAPLAYTESDAATVLDPGISLSDVDDSHIAGATVQITGNFLSSEDVLSFTDQSGITGSWNPATGTLTLTGTASKADYQAALRSITYQNSNDDNPSPATRTVTFSVTDSNSNGEGSGALTTTATRQILFSAVNDAPGISATAAPLAYTESDAATVLDPGISLSDVDDSHISGATVQITGNFLSSEDALSFTDQSGITGSWNPATGTLTLTGTASKADYQAALRSITYQNSNDDNPSPATRTVTFSVSDSNSNGEGSGALTTTATRQILFSAVNDAPGISATAAPLAYTESDAATLMDPGISLSDVDDSHIAGATVQITGNFLSSEDVLSFVDQSGITGSWNSATGTLTLTGTATKADYQDALRSITYQNSNDDNPSPATRTVTFSVTDSNSNGEGSGALTTTATRQILFSAVNDAPGISATAAPLAYTESDAATVLDPGISLSDVDDSHIAGATVQITGNFLSSEDVLSFVDQSGITGSWNPATGTLTLTGTASKADYQAALRSITYQNSNDDNPSPATRTVTFSVTDSNSNGEGSGALTTTATRQILFSAVNDAPGISATAAPLAYTESDAATPMDPGISLADVDDTHISGATVQITGNFLSSEDVLSFTDQSGITGSWNPATGILTLTGTATKADYQAALRAITYENLNNDNPSPATRTVTFSVTDSNSNGEGTGALTTTATRQILFSAVNDAPGISATAAPLAYTESDSATVLDPGISLSDVDDSHIAGATVQITGNFLSSEDLLNFVDQPGITGSWNPATGTLTLTGTASKADYQAALRSITYQNSNDDNPSPATRTVTFSVTDSNSNGEGSGALTTTATRQILFSAVNDAPGVATTAAPLAYTESNAATPMDAGISLADVDDTHISGATVQITGNFLSSEDVLSFTDQSGITGSWNPATGTLTLTGTASKADYQAALRSITYQNSNDDNPSPDTRTVTFSVTDSNSNGEGSGALTTTATRQILFSAVNDAPGVATTAAPLAYTESDAATVLDPGISLSDVDDSHISGATVQITGNFLSSEDALSFTDQSGITGSWNPATGTLTLTGTASKADYQAALRSITYQNSNDDNPSPATRTVTFSVTDSNSNGEGTGALTTTTTRQILFSAVNDAPAWNGRKLPEPRGREEAFLKVALDPHLFFSDVDSPVLTYAVDALPDFLHFDPDTHTVSGTPGQGARGTYAIQITATDEAGASATITMTLVIDPAPTRVGEPTVPQQPLPVSDPTPPRNEPLMVVTPSDHPLKDRDEEPHRPRLIDEGTDPFQFSALRDGRHTFGTPPVFPDPVQEIRANTPNQGATESTFQLLVERSDAIHADDGATRSIAGSPSVEEINLESLPESGNGSKRLELQIGTTLRESDAQWVMPQPREDDRRHQRGVKGYGATEGSHDERGMPGLTNQLNVHGTKGFHAATQELLRMLKEGKG